MWNKRLVTMSNDMRHKNEVSHLQGNGCSVDFQAQVPLVSALISMETEAVYLRGNQMSRDFQLN